MATDLLDEEHTDDPSRLLYSTRSGKTVMVKEKVYVALQNGIFTDVEDRHLTTLKDLEILVPELQDEFDEVLGRNVSVLDSAKSVNVTIQPTANCQLGCNYCGQVHSKKNVDEETSIKITDRIIHNLKKNSFESIMVQWYGGEPLMAQKEILAMSERMIDYCKANGIRYSAHMITNGVNFKPNIFLKLLEKKITHYQITLDGLGETHDLFRITKEGKKTFEIIFGNIVNVINLPEFADNHCNITVRVNVTRASAKSIHKLIDRLAYYNLQRGVSLHFAPVSDWGGNNAQKSSLSREEFAVAEIDWILYGIQKGFKFRNVLPRRTVQPCMTVQKDAEVYDANGNIYPCYEYPYTPKFAEAEYKIGNVDTIDVERNEHAITRDWYRDIKTDIAPCKTCNLFPVCGGGCPKQWYEKDVACPSYKINIKDKLLMHHLMKKDGNLQDFLENNPSN
ncbi:radical SAM/SPASM domain-containing protein [Janthinobacterium fluminis]|uniref:Radical SAM protein n=1 Tax=Janthinobacterium fluminis TaxID=2987524 RepID=A0ABT5K2A9_9BURK|nr:radical SAM protein [Janthinobacterium fluminis]MDC8758805.1 radical SAM protein [Janthinobacterium fluminis]